MQICISGDLFILTASIFLVHQQVPIRKEEGKAGFVFNGINMTCVFILKEKVEVVLISYTNHVVVCYREKKELEVFRERPDEDNFILSQS
ncbi:hypothetical protein A0J61_03050 [Choanephora cucurbitarum]|uniref:Uncharacterized protein n=1 Tax=Choanephora cucurbitarum TaxID=101091 RepID=A0A1C7NK69_9FUNG|nr:hypothetical protein A0J61_03050 [Choanephora cucurbitarum]